MARLYSLSRRRWKRKKTKCKCWCLDFRKENQLKWDELDFELTSLQQNLGMMNTKSRNLSRGYMQGMP